MTQAPIFGVPRSGPVAPDVMAGRIDDNFDAQISSHSGASRPTYAVAGTMWLSTATAGLHTYYFYDGVNDRLVLTIDTATGAQTRPSTKMSGPLDMNYNAIQNPAGLQLSGLLNGLTTSNNVSDATNDIDIAAGTAASDAATPTLITLASALTKRLDAVWAVGTGNGGLDTGSIANGTYHIWLIQRSDTGVVDALFSASATSPTMPTSYDRKRRIGSIIRASAAILPFTQIGNRYLLATPVTIRSSTGGSGNILLTCTAPVGIRTRPILSSTIGMSAASAGGNQIGDGDLASPNIAFQSANGSQFDTTIVECVYTNTSAQVRFLASASSGTFSSNTMISLGWWDDRGINV